MSEAQHSHTPPWKSPLMIFKISANPKKQSLRPGAPGGDAGAVGETSLMPLLESGVNRGSLRFFLHWVCDETYLWVSWCNYLLSWLLSLSHPKPLQTQVSVALWQLCPNRAACNNIHFIISHDAELTGLSCVVLLFRVMWVGAASAGQTWLDIQDSFLRRLAVGSGFAGDSAGAAKQRDSILFYTASPGDLCFSQHGLWILAARIPKKQK